MHKTTTWNIVFFIAPLLEITVKNHSFDPLCSYIKFSKELLSVAMKNNMHYLKQYTADSTSVCECDYFILPLSEDRYRGDIQGD